MSNTANLDSTLPAAPGGSQNVTWQLDPATGNVSGYVPDSSSGITLETMGTPNAIQNLLNLIAGTGIVLTADGAGGVTIRNIVSGITLQTNGVANGSQILLNIAAGSGITAVDNGAGRVTISGATATLFETNGTPNATQTTLNLVAGSNITLTNSGGAVTIASTGGGAGVTLQTNGVNNATQTTLNLIAGTNVTLTNSGANVTIAASGGGSGSGIILYSQFTPPTTTSGAAMNMKGPIIQCNKNMQILSMAFLCLPTIGTTQFQIMIYQLGGTVAAPTVAAILHTGTIQTPGVSTLPLYIDENISSSPVNFVAGTNYAIVIQSPNSATTFIMPLIACSSSVMSLPGGNVWGGGSGSNIQSATISPSVGASLTSAVGISSPYVVELGISI